MWHSLFYLASYFTKHHILKKIEGGGGSFQWISPNTIKINENRIREKHSNNKGRLSLKFSK